MKPVSSFLALAISANASLAQEPLSAIEWLNDPAFQSLEIPGVVLDEPSVSDSAVSPAVSVAPLEVQGDDAVGLLPTSVTGLPGTLWRMSALADLRKELALATRVELPALRALVFTLLLAEADAPNDTGQGSEFLQARISALVDMGAVEPALALLERANPTTQALRKAWFDLSLLNDQQEPACAMQPTGSDATRDYASNIFCAAHDGDWMTAALLYDTASALSLLSPVEKNLLLQFLDPEMIEESPSMAPPARPSPLVFYLHETIGEPLPTSRLPLAYAQADLRDTAGWKAQLEAAERLARAGTLTPNRLLGLYTERAPAASGSVWERAAAIQRLDTALASGDPDEIEPTLSSAWHIMREARLAVPFANMFVDRLMQNPSFSNNSPLAFELALLTGEYEIFAKAYTGEMDQRMRFLSGLARGDVAELPATSLVERAIAQGFGSQPVPEIAQEMLSEKKLGEAILRAVNLLGAAGDGNPEDITQALALLRTVGLEDTARRAALQTLVLGARQ